MQEKEKIALNKGGESVDIMLNPEIYPVQAVFGAAYSFMDRAYAVIDGDKKSIVVRLWPKGKLQLKETALLFSQELLNYMVCLSQAKKTEKVRLALAKKAFLAHSGAGSGESLFVNDPLGIASPWQEQHKKD